MEAVNTFKHIHFMHAYADTLLLVIHARSVEAEFG